ncbi:MAG: cytochrome c-type biogenesis protein CcmH [Zoogloeaceae bacterium]|jgi:cytochrome c-type biogenesis protein CcmH|nr:cytochrome c-type biogenesis protein CcmH [Zoogloeaceae bacterium]
MIPTGNLKVWARMLLILPLLCCLAAVSPARAEEAAPLAADPAAEKRLQAIAAELRCLVCQNDTIAASSADLAQDLRRQIREMIAAGKSDAEITDYMVARYGDFVLYRPPLKRSTFLLWLGPPLFFVLAFLLLRRYLKRRQQTLSAAPPLTDAERRAAEALLRGDAAPEQEST